MKSVWRTERGNFIAELGPVLLIIFILIMFPLLDLVTYLCGVSTVQLAVNEASRAASTAEIPADALVAVQNAVTAVRNTGMGKFTRLTPVGGNNNSGIDLNVRIAVSPTNERSFSVPSQLPLPENLRPKEGNNKTDLIYEYQANGRFICSPLIDMSAIPLLKGIPILSPTEIKYTSEHQVENLSGLD